MLCGPVILNFQTVFNPSLEHLKLVVAEAIQFKITGIFSKYTKSLTLSSMMQYVSQL